MKDKRLIILLGIIILIKLYFGPLLISTFGHAKDYFSFKYYQKADPALEKKNLALEKELSNRSAKLLNIFQLKQEIYTIYKKNNCALFSESISNSKSSSKEININYHLKGSYSDLSRTVTDILGLEQPIGIQRLSLKTNANKTLDLLFTLKVLNAKEKIL